MVMSDRYAASSAYQHGAVLVVALVMLILLTLLGITAMNVSQQQLTMSGYTLWQSEAREQAETCLRIAESAVMTLVDTQLNVSGGSFITAPGHLDVAGGAEPAAVGEPDWWQDPANALPCGANGLYVIEYLGVQDIVPSDIRFTDKTEPMHAFRITARGNGLNDASVLLQTIYLRNSI